MPIERYRTQVLLLHSQQGTLDNLSAGFNDKYSVHCATSGSEALNTLGETPIDIIVSAQDLPGMSGLEALREAKKRSPDTIGILLAGANKSDGLEALVGDKEVFQVIRGEVTPESLLSVIESATQRVRLLALAESANDNAANVDEPITESIVMETSENGALIISDGTGRMPALKPQTVQLSADTATRDVDLLVMTRDEEFLETINASARGLHHMHHALTTTQAENFVHDKRVGVLLIDAAMVGSEVERLIQKLRKERPRMVAIVAGRRDDGEMLMDLINRGHVYRFLLKPVSPGRARLAIEASVKHHLEAPDAAFKTKPPGQSPTRPLAKAKATPKREPGADATIPVLHPAPKRTPQAAPEPTQKQAPKPVQKPATKATPKPPKPAARKATPKPAPKPAARKAPKPTPKAAPGGEARPTPSPAPAPKGHKQSKAAARIEPTISSPPATERLYDAAAAKRRIKATLASAGSLASGAQGAVQASGEAVVDAVGSAFAAERKSGTLGIAAGTIAALALGAWLFTNRDSIAPAVFPPDQGAPREDVAAEETESVPTIVESDITFALPGRESEIDAGPEIPAYQALLDEARAASDAGNYIEPTGHNAVELYLAVLDEAPDDPLIAGELDYVIEQVLGLAESAILEQNIEEASDALAMVRLADPANSRLAFLGAQLTQIRLRATVDEARLAIRDGLLEDAAQLISEARYLGGGASAEIDQLSQELSAARSQQKVDEVLAVAGEHLEAGNLVAPSNNNARYYYELALSNDPGNQAAQQGLAIVAGKLVLKAREAMDDGRLDDAADLLHDAQALDPDSSELAASSQALDTAIEARAEAEREAEAARLAELERQAELARQAEAERQAELRRQAERERQAELQRQTELERQAEAARLEEIERQEEEARLAKAKEAEQQNAEKVASAAATTSALGVAGSKVRESNANAAPPSSSANPAPAPAAPRTPPNRSVQQSASAGPETGVRRPDAAQAEMPTVTLPLTAGVVEGARTFGMAGGGSGRASAPRDPAQGFSAADDVPGSQSGNAARNTTVPISSLTRINYVAPEYPRSAQRRNLTGSVDVVFTVSTIGTVKEVRVISAEPEGTFDQAAIDAVSKWRFEPVIENGVALERQTAVRLSFNLE